MINGEFPASIVNAIKRTHVNLGHPTKAEMVRILRRSGASEEAILAAKGLVRNYCLEKKKPKPPRTARTPSMTPPLQAVQIDEKEMPDWRPGRKRKCLGEIEAASELLPQSTRKEERVVAELRDLLARRVDRGFGAGIGEGH